jgi:WD40 repeat protein
VGGDPDSDGVVVKLWDLATDKVLASLKGNKGPVRCIAFSPDGATLAAGSGWGDDGGACFIWCFTNSTYQSSVNLVGTDSLSFSPDGKTLATVAWNKVLLWDATTWKLRNTLKGHSGAIGEVSFLPDGHSLVSCGTDRTVRMWQWPADDPTNVVGRIIGAHLDAATRLAVARDGSMLATGANDGTVKLWNIADHDARQDSQASAEFKFGDDGGWHNLRAVLSLPDRKRLLVVTQDGTEVRDLVSGRKLASWPDAAGCGALSADGKLLATGQGDGTLKLWDVATQKLIASVKTEFVTPVLAFSQDGRTLAAGGDADGKSGSRLIRMWDVAAGLKPIRTIDTSVANIHTFSFSPDGKTLAAARGDILLFDALKGQASGIIRIADQMNVCSIVFSPDSRILATGREGGVLCLWDAQTGELIKELNGHTSNVYALAFTPDGGTLASGVAGATVRLWDVQTGQERLTLTSSNSQVSVRRDRSIHEGHKCCAGGDRSFAK